MASAHQDQRGTSIIEGLLVVIIVAIIGFVGWYVYHTKQNSNKALDAASSTSQNASPRFSSKSSKVVGSTDNQSLQNDLNSAASLANQGSKDLNSANSSLNDQSTLTSVPQ